MQFFVVVKISITQRNFGAIQSLFDALESGIENRFKYMVERRMGLRQGVA